MNIHIQYYALLREERGVSFESLETSATTASDLYQELQRKYPFRLSIDKLKVAINNEFCDWSQLLKDNDSVIFIPPVAGG